nr:MAG TPA: hypothetical protein [Caudoviricetes sp.]
MYSFAMLIRVNVVDADTTDAYNVKHRKLLVT